jgi:hypothetical protein
MFPKLECRFCDHGSMDGYRSGTVADRSIYIGCTRSFEIRIALQAALLINVSGAIGTASDWKLGFANT